MNHIKPFLLGVVLTISVLLGIAATLPTQTLTIDSTGLILNTSPTITFPNAAKFIGSLTLNNGAGFTNGVWYGNSGSPIMTGQQVTNLMFSTDGFNFYWEDGNLAGISSNLYTRIFIETNGTTTKIFPSGNVLGVTNGVITAVGFVGPLTGTAATATKPVLSGSTAVMAAGVDSVGNFTTNGVTGGSGGGGDVYRANNQTMTGTNTFLKPIIASGGIVIGTNVPVTIYDNNVVGSFLITNTTDLGSVIVSNGDVSISGAYNGSGSGLTGTAASLSIGGSATTAGTATYVASAMLTNKVSCSNVICLTNSATATPDMSIPVGTYQATTFSFTGLTGLSTTNYQTKLLRIYYTGFSQSSATAISLPANIHVQGAVNVTNQTDVMLDYDPTIPITNALCYPRW